MTDGDGSEALAASGRIAPSPKERPPCEILRRAWAQVLTRILGAAALAEPELGYVQGMSYVAAFVLLVCGPRRPRSRDMLEKEK